MTAGIGSFVLNDALVKFESGRLPVSQIMCIRGVFATAFLVLVACAMRARVPLHSLAHPRVLTRSVLDALGSAAFVMSLVHLPLANASAINAATPLMLSLMAVLILREHISLGRWVAVAVGFLGVLLIVQPSGAAFNAWSLLCLFGTVLSATRDFFTRFIDRGIPSIVLTISNAALVAVLAGIWGLFQTWAPVATGDVLLLAAAGACMASGYLCIAIAMRTGEMSAVVPFRYCGLLFACTLGFLGWGEIPNLVAWVGMGLLVLAGVWIATRG